jgi:hypothetical protein
MAELQIILVPVSITSLTLGYHFAYRQDAGGRRQRVMLWIATPISLALWIVPWMLR